jgi:hypothetical protein
MLCDFKAGFLANFLEDEPSTYRHQFGSRGLAPRDAVGIMYTCAGGFIDFGHLRDNADLTFFYFRALTRGAWRKGTRIAAPPGIRGTVEILADVPRELGVDLARHLTYNESIYHEIETYWDRSTGAHHSSFSPEDLVSNYLGNYVAALALELRGDFSSATGTALAQLMRQLGVVSKADTQLAFDAVRNTWVRGASSRSVLLPDDYLRRRSLTTWPQEPWLVDNFGPCTGSTATFPDDPDFEIDPLAAAFAKVDYEVPAASRGPGKIDAETVTPADFPALITAIKNDARNLYGPDFDSPAPVGRLGP